MCAIHGMLWVDPEAMRRMCNAAAHRGPHGGQVWYDDRVTLGHNLLAVSDVIDNSRQPFGNAGGKLVFNGEVYNYEELRRTIKSTPLRTSSDTELLAAGLWEQGVKFLEQIDGMFALAWYDFRSGHLTVARDPDGTRPLYYTHVYGKGWAFSTEIKSLLTLRTDRQVSWKGFKHYYHAGVVNGPLTLFNGINRVTPGAVSVIDVLTGDVRPHTDLTAEPRKVTTQPKHWPADIRNRVASSVAACAGSRRKTGLLLSGGIDSGAVLYEMSRLKGTPETFTTRFVTPHPRCRHNEDADVAVRLAEHFGTNHHETTVGEGEWVSAVEPTLRMLEEPRQSKSLPAYYLTYKMLHAAGVIVALSGDGGDELFMGYKHHLSPPFQNRLGGLRAGHRPLPDKDLHLSFEEQVEYLDGWLPQALYTGDLGNDYMHTDSLFSLAEDFLIRGDKLGGAFGMETRFPLLGRSLKEYVRGIPSRFKQPRGNGPWSVESKPLLRQAYHDRLPGWVLDRAKTGWRAPTDDWVVGVRSHPAKDGPVRQYARETLRDPDIRELFGITDDVIEDRYLNNRDFAGPKKASGKPGVGPGLSSQKELFTILMFAAWYKAFGMRLW